MPCSCSWCSRPAVRNYRVELSSMEATLFPKDRLVVNKLVYTRLDPEAVDELVPLRGLMGRPG